MDALSFAESFAFLPDQLVYCEHGNQFDPAPSGAAPARLRAQVRLPVLHNPANRSRAVPLTYEQFRCGFANAVSEEEANQLDEEFAVPSTGKPLF